MASSKLPTEILVEEILPRLPAKSLLRFKCVSKFFQTLISTPKFIHRHLLHSLSSDSDRQLILMEKWGSSFSFHFDSPEFPPVRLPFPRDIFKGSGDGLFMIGSCNGLVCIGTTLPSLLIFNPSTGIYRLIDNIFPLGSRVSYGFGFDDINDDYKVLRVTNEGGFKVNDNFKFSVRREVEVYSLKSGSWSLVGTKSDPDLIKLKENGTLLDNHLVHWKFLNPSSDTYRIGCFDLRNDRWGDDVPFSDQMEIYDIEQTNLVHLGVLDGCLCLLKEDVPSNVFDVWVMKEYGVKDSWVKLVSVSFVEVSPTENPFAYAKGSWSEVLVRMDSMSKFFWYNIRDKTWRPAEIHGVENDSEACLCTGSLVSIPGGVRFEICASKSQG